MARRIWVVVTVVGGMLLASIGLVRAQEAGPQSAEAYLIPSGTAFMYQGQSQGGRAGVTGSREMVFRVFDSAIWGSPVGAPLAQTVAAKAGLITTQSDFGADPLSVYDDGGTPGNWRLNLWDTSGNAVGTPNAWGIRAYAAPRESAPLQADVSLVVTSSANEILPGATLTYTFVVANAGPQLATNVSMSATLPTPWTFNNGSISQGSCTISGITHLLDCSFGSIALDHTATVILKGTIDAAAVCPATMTFTARASSDLVDPFLRNNADTSSVALLCPEADVSLVVTSSANEILPGATLTYTFVVSNAGPQLATNVSMSATLPTPWTFSNGSISQGSCTISGITHLLDCSFGSIALDHTATVILKGTIDVAAVCPATMTFTARASSDLIDPFPNNNTDTSLVVFFCSRLYLPAVLR